MHQAARNRWPELRKVAELANRVLKRQPVLSNPKVSLPTPSAAAWTVVQSVAQQTADISDFVDSFHQGYAASVVKCSGAAPSNADHPQYDLLRLRHELLMLPYNLLAGHLPNLDLDVSELMRWVLPAFLSSVWSCDTHTAIGQLIVCTSPTPRVLLVWPCT